MAKLPNLFVFDFDETLSVRSSCYPLEELAKDREKLNLRELDHRYETEHRCWNQRMTELHRRLAQQGIHTPQLIEAFRALELSPGTDELFQAIHANHDKIVVLSNAYDLVVEECLRARNLLQYVEKIESNPVRQVEPAIIVDEYANPLQTSCTLCDPNLCKGAVIDQYRDSSSYNRIIFVGDGDNDVCPALRLGMSDYAFAKSEGTAGTVYPMAYLLQNQYSPQLKAGLFLWKTLKDVLDTLKNEHIL